MKRYVFSTLLLVLSVLIWSPQVGAFNTGIFERLANDTIAATISGQVNNVGKLIRIQEKLMEIGVDACEDYAISSPENAAIMQIIIDNAPEMTRMSLREMEMQFHDGYIFREYGIDMYDIDFMNPVHAYIAMVTRPATAIIALKEYETTKNPEFLNRVRRELSEALSQLTQLQFQ